MKEVTREHFGPFAVVVLCQDEDDFMACCRNSRVRSRAAFIPGRARL